MLEVVADTARLAHAAGRKDDFGHRVGVDHPGFVTGNADPQPRELDRIDVGVQQRPGLGIVTLFIRVLENAGGLNGQRAVDVDREVAVAGDKTFFLDLPDEVEQLLGAAHRKAGDDHIAAPVERPL